MKQYRYFLYAFALFGALLSTSCLKDSRNIPNTPAIEFADFVKLANDSADFSFTFKDGDGNIGLRANDTSGQFSINNAGGEYYYNLHMIYYFKDVDGKFKRYFNVNTNDSQRITARIPDIQPVGQNKILDGTIKFRIDPPYWFPSHTTIKFDAYIYDRDLNKSNVITSPEITTPG